MDRKGTTWPKIVPATDSTNHEDNEQRDYELVSHLRVVLFHIPTQYLNVWTRSRDVTSLLQSRLFFNIPWKIRTCNWRFFAISKLWLPLVSKHNSLIISINACSSFPTTVMVSPSEEDNDMNPPQKWAFATLLDNLTQTGRKKKQWVWRFLFFREVTYLLL